MWRNGESLAGALDDSDDWERIHRDEDFSVWVRA